MCKWVFHYSIVSDLMEIWAEYRGSSEEQLWKSAENSTILVCEAWEHFWCSARLAFCWRQRNKWVKVSKEMWTRVGILWKEEFEESWWTGSSVKAEPCQFPSASVMLRRQQVHKNYLLSEWKKEGKEGRGREGGKNSSLYYQEEDGYNLRQSPGWNSNYM